MKILVVNLGGQWTHRIWRRLNYLGCESAIIEPDTPIEKLGDVDGLVLSGGAVRIGSGGEKIVKHVASYLDNLGKPIVGLCAGHQFMAIHFGGTSEPAKIPEYGQVEIEVLNENDLFKGIPKKFTAWASHNDEVTSAPGFEVLAKSRDCKIEAMRHKKMPLYGIQFHPEVEHTKYGEKIFENFVGVCKR
ncbi:MAG: GMP synthase subunit A [Candidatus Diapherotrites archaeon]|nr:GMP synthase subunit A [Candidatus Diapherotrites archaeon]